MQGVGRSDVLLHFKCPATKQMRCPVTNILHQRTLNCKIFNVKGEETADLNQSRTEFKSSVDRWPMASKFSSNQSSATLR
ncbi:MAG: hypothetical protein WBV21_20180, partial [Desulfobacterales bacterium]